jgi:hypothetical protein
VVKTSGGRRSPAAVAALADTMLGMDNAPAKPRRRFRFGLRTLLAVVTVAAVASWGYWVAWPWWQAYWEQTRFEKAVKQLKVGDTLNSERGNIPFHPANGGPSYTMAFEQARIGLNRYYGLSTYFLKNAAYFVVYSYPKEKPEGKTVRQWPCVSIQVFRLPSVPKDYLSHREAHSASHIVPPSMKLPETPEAAFENDFLNFFNINGDQVEKYGIPCELIYSDPPATPAAK